MILHIDMDAFFAMLEVRRRPELKGLPVVVGGLGRRGVVSTASYEARVYGVKSALPMAQARKKCPQAIFLPGDHKFYSEASKRIMQIFYKFSPYLEPLSLDEAFLDVSGVSRSRGSATDIAQQLRTEILEREELACSVGISTQKHISKIASEKAKPQILKGEIVPGVGILEVPAGKELEFLSHLKIEEIWGVGPNTARKLQQQGIKTVSQILDFDIQELESLLGSAAAQKIHALASAQDHRMVQRSTRMPKSMSSEETFAVDVEDKEILNHHIVRLSDKLMRRLRSEGMLAKHLTLKIRYSKDFRTITRSQTLPSFVDTAASISKYAKQLLDRENPNKNLQEGVRLIGVGVSGLSMEKEKEEDLFSGTEDRWSRVESTLDAIRHKYAEDAIEMGSNMFLNLK